LFRNLQKIKQTITNSKKSDTCSPTWTITDYMAHSGTVHAKLTSHLKANVKANHVTISGISYECQVSAHRKDRAISSDGNYLPKVAKLNSFFQLKKLVKLQCTFNYFYNFWHMYHLLTV